MTDSLAYIVENDVILEGIMRALKAMKDRVEVRYRTKAVSFSIPGRLEPPEVKLPYIEMTLSDGTTVRTKLLVSCFVYFSCQYHPPRKSFSLRVADIVQNVQWSSLICLIMSVLRPFIRQCV